MDVERNPAPVGLDEFLEWEQRQERRYEYIDGVIRAMVGGTLRHSMIASNIFAALRPALRAAGGAVFLGGVKVLLLDRIYYPDVVATCSGFDPNDFLVPDPVLIAEVLSDSTRLIDRREKAIAYQALPALQLYLIVAQDERRIEGYRRAGTAWQPFLLTTPAAEPLATDALALAHPPVTLTLDQIYEGI